MENLQAQRSNGTWMDLSSESGIDFIQRCANFNATTIQDVIDKIENGTEVKWDTDWNGVIRKKRAPTPECSIIDSHVEDNFF